MPEAVVRPRYVTNQKYTVAIAALNADHKDLNYSLFAIKSAVDFGFNELYGNHSKKPQTGGIRPHSAANSDGAQSKNMTELN